MSDPNVYVVGWNSDTCTVGVGNMRYIYRASIPGIELKTKVEGMAKHSGGRCLQYLRKYCTLVDKYSLEES